jgi:hypothetical protein
MKLYLMIAFIAAIGVCRAEITTDFLEDALAAAIRQRKEQSEQFPGEEAVRLEISFYASRMGVVKDSLIILYESLWSETHRSKDWYEREAVLVSSIEASFNLLKRLYSLLVKLDDDVPSGIVWRLFQRERQRFEPAIYKATI